MADVEKLQNFKEKVTNLSDGSTLTTWKALFTQLLNLYLDEMLETFVGSQAALDAKRTGINNAATTLLNLLDLPTDKVLKGGA